MLHFAWSDASYYRPEYTFSSKLYLVHWSINIWHSNLFTLIPYVLEKVLCVLHLISTFLFCLSETNMFNNSSIIAWSLVVFLSELKFLHLEIYVISRNKSTSSIFTTYWSPSTSLKVCHRLHMTTWKTLQLFTGSIN